MDTVRTFIGVDIKLEKELIEIWSNLKLILKDDSIRWVNSSTIHLTLLFLGETPLTQIKKISDSLRYSLVEFPAFKISIKGVGTFGKPLPKIIWLGVEPNQNLVKLKHLVDESLIPFGFKDENITFSPHLTLGRIKFLKHSIAFQEFLNKYNKYFIQDMYVDKVQFFQSTLTEHGAIYKPFEIIELKI
jgi:2'-5' RNA ligase